MDILRVSSHELLNDWNWFIKNLFLSTRPMIDRACFESIHLIQFMVLFNKGNKMSLSALFTLGLTFRRCWFMLLLYLLTLFEKFPSVLCCFCVTLRLESIQIWVFFNKVRILFNCVKYDVKKSDRATCVVCVLFHEKNIFRYQLGFEV